MSLVFQLPDLALCGLVRSWFFLPLLLSLLGGVYIIVICKDLVSTSDVSHCCHNAKIKRPRRLVLMAVYPVGRVVLCPPDWSLNVLERLLVALPFFSSILLLRVDRFKRCASGGCPYS
jgi:hypothetical protein